MIEIEIPTALASAAGALTSIAFNAACDKWKKIQGEKRLDAAIKLIQSRGLEVQHATPLNRKTGDSSGKDLQHALAVAGHAGYVTKSKEAGASSDESKDRICHRHPPA